MKKESRKTDKICVVCGNGFKGTAAAKTCSPACRTALARIKAAHKRPEFILLAKSKGQKIPDLNAPKGVRLKKGEKKKKVVVVTDLSDKELTQQGMAASESSLEKTWGKDEPISEVPILTKEQKTAKISELEKQIDKIKAEKSPMAGNPKIFILNQSMRIDEIQEQIQGLKQ